MLFCGVGRFHRNRRRGRGRIAARRPPFDALTAGGEASLPDGAAGAETATRAQGRPRMSDVLPQRKRLPHGQPHVWNAISFITVCCAHRDINTLANATVAPALWNAWAGYAMRGQCAPILFVVMPDHIHGLFRFPVEPGMSAVVGAWKRLTARRYGISWQRDFFDHRLRNEESLEEKAAYIRDNPLRKGLVAVASDWPYVWPG